MAEITLTVTGTAGFGVDMTTAQFDHASLVAAGRSRADGYDFWMYHTTAGRVRMLGTHDLNTAAAVVEFLAPVTSTGDAGYRLVFGDLGQQASRVDASVVASTGDVTAASVPALVLPTPSHAVTRSVRYRRGEHAYPDNVVTRRRDYNESPLTVLACEWRNPTPEDWYAVRAWHDASLGGSVYGTLAWESGSWRPLPGSLALSEEGRGTFYARLEVEGVPS